MRALLSLLLLASAGLMAGGCATAGLGLVGPLAGSLTAIVDRSVERTLPADLSTTWGATADALARMAVRIEETDKSGAKWHLTGDELLNQISASLASLAGMGRRDGTNADASSERLRLLQRELQRLGTKIAQAREAPPPTARPEVPPVATVSPTPIIVIPASAGVATVPAPDIPLARQAAPSAFRRPAGPRDLGPGAPLQTAEPQESRADDILAAPMRSVETLRPVEALRIRPVGQ
jgi:hypothetical protein